MKLHLPKLLLTAVLAACVMSSQAWALSVSSGDSGTTVTNADGTWTETYTSVYTPTSSSDFPTETVDAVIVASGKLGGDDHTYTSASNAQNIVVGGSGQLILQTWNKGAINLDSNLILGSNSNASTASLVLKEFSGAINLNGTVTLVEDTYVWMEGKTSNTVTFNEAVSGANYTLTTSCLKNTTFAADVTLGGLTTTKINADSENSSQINHMTFNGNVSIDSLNVESETTLIFSGQNKSVVIGQVSGSGILNTTIGEGVTFTLGSSLKTGTLTNNGTLVVEDWSGFEYAAAGGEDATENGLYEMTKTYKVLNGCTLDTSSISTTFTYGDQTYNIADGYTKVEGNIYAVVSDTVTVGGTEATEDTENADAFLVKGGTLKLAEGSLSTDTLKYTAGTLDLGSGTKLTIKEADDSQTATSLLVNTTGVAGSVVEIAANANFGAVDDGSSHTTDFAGKWVVTNGATLKLGGLDSGWNNDYRVDLLALEALELNGGTIRYFGGNSNVSKLVVSAASTVDIYEMYDNDRFLTFNTVELNADLTIKASWRGHVNIKSLTGGSTLIVGANGESKIINVNAASDFTGQIDMNGGSGTTLNITTEENATVTIKADSDSTIEKVVLANGSTLAYDSKYNAYTYTINNVEVEGTATLGLDASTTYYQGCLNIGNLTNAEGSTSGELTLGSNYRNGPRNITNLNGGDFDGKINYVTNSNNTRKHGLNINHATVAADAEISISHKNSTSHSVALGIGADKVTVKALSGGSDGAAVYSGQQAYGNSDAFAAIDDTVRTLEIATDDKEYNANIGVKNNINLVKSGSGTQNISGNMANFDGTVEVSGGVLGFTNAAEDASVTVSSLTLTGGTLNVTGSLTLDALSIDLDSYTAGENVDLVTAAGGLALGDGVDLTQWQNVTVGSYTADVTQSDTGLSLTFKEIVTSKEITTTVSGFGGLADGMLTLNVGTDLADATSVLITGISDDIMKQILGDANLPEGGMVGITLLDKDGVEFTATADQMIGFQGNDGGVYYGQQVGTAWQYQAAYIPEPTTATLSLLALAGLAARRRRKA